VSGGGWIDTDYLVTDKDGSFIDVFFQKSAVVYDYDSFGPPFMDWLDDRLDIASVLATAVELSMPNATDSTFSVRNQASKSTETTASASVSTTAIKAQVSSDSSLSDTLTNATDESDGYYMTDGEGKIGQNKTMRKQAIKKTGEVVVEKENSPDSQQHEANGEIEETENGTVHNNNENGDGNNDNDNGNDIGTNDNDGNTYNGNADDLDGPAENNRTKVNDVPVQETYSRKEEPKKNEKEQNQPPTRSKRGDISTRKKIKEEDAPSKPVDEKYAVTETGRA